MIFRQMFEEKYMRFPEGKSKAVTFSYDDGVQADKRLLKVFAKYGLKGTFNLNSDLFDCANWHDRMNEEETYNAFKDCGQEIAVHGARHIFLNKVPLPEAVNEVVECRRYLENKFERTVRGMAYAYNGYNADILNVLPALGVDYARTTESTHLFSLPENWLLWHPTCHHGDKKLASLSDKFLSSSPEEESKAREPWLFYIWGHAYEYDDNNNWDVIEKLSERLSQSEGVWFATNGEIYAYAQAYSRLVYSLDGERVYNPSAISVWVELRGKVYEIPSGRTVAFDKQKRIEK